MDVGKNDKTHKADDMCFVEHLHEVRVTVIVSNFVMGKGHGHPRKTATPVLDARQGKGDT